MTPEPDWKKCLHSWGNKCRLKIKIILIYVFTFMSIVTLATFVPFCTFPGACHSLWLTSWYFELYPFILSTAKLLLFCFPCLEGYFGSVNTLQHIRHLSISSLEPEFMTFQHWPTQGLNTQLPKIHRCF